MTSARSAVNAIFQSGNGSSNIVSSPSYTVSATVPDAIREARGLAQSIATRGKQALATTGRRTTYRKYGLPFPSRSNKSTQKVRVHQKRLIVIEYYGDTCGTETLTDGLIVIDGSIRYQSNDGENEIRQKIKELISKKDDKSRLYGNVQESDFEFVRVTNKRIRKPDGDTPYDALGINTVFPTGAIYVKLTKDFAIKSVSMIILLLNHFGCLSPMSIYDTELIISLPIIHFDLYLQKYNHASPP